MFSKATFPKIGEYQLTIYLLLLIIIITIIITTIAVAYAMLCFKTKMIALGRVWSNILLQQHVAQTSALEHDHSFAEFL